jgi:hypothetical protein
MLNIGRPFGRLVDDEWQKALFTRDNADLPRATLAKILLHVSQYSDGRLNELEDNFCQELKKFYRANMSGQTEFAASNFATAPGNDLSGSAPAFAQ